MSTYFKRQGYEVDCAREQAEAEALLARNHYACVITDLRLSPAHGNAGLEIVAHVRERSPSTRTIILTAYGSPATEWDALRHGAGAFFHKPTPLSELARAVASLIERGS